MFICRTTSFVYEIHEIQEKHSLLNTDSDGSPTDTRVLCSTNWELIVSN